MSPTIPLNPRELASLFNSLLSCEAKPVFAVGFSSSIFTIASEDKYGVVETSEEIKRQTACISLSAIYWHVFS